MLRDQEKNKDNWHYRMEMGQTYSKNEGQQVDQTLHRVATKEREEIKRTTKQKMARGHSKERGNHLDQESKRQSTMEGIDGGLHPAVDGQSLGEMWNVVVVVVVVVVVMVVANNNNNNHDDDDDDNNNNNSDDDDNITGKYTLSSTQCSCCYLLIA